MKTSGVKCPNSVQIDRNVSACELDSRRPGEAYSHHGIVSETINRAMNVTRCASGLARPWRTENSVFVRQGVVSQANHFEGLGHTFMHVFQNLRVCWERNQRGQIRRAATSTGFAL